jgi:hypothetical protein
MKSRDRAARRFLHALAKCVDHIGADGDAVLLDRGQAVSPCPGPMLLRHALRSATK